MKRKKSRASSCKPRKNWAASSIPSMADMFYQLRVEIYCAMDHWFCQPDATFMHWIRIACQAPERGSWVNGPRRKFYGNIVPRMMGHIRRLWLLLCGCVRRTFASYFIFAVRCFFEICLSFEILPIFLIPFLQYYNIISMKKKQSFNAIKTRGESVAIALALVGAEPIKEGTGRILRSICDPWIN